jgi:hypothetical protein
MPKISEVDISVIRHELRTPINHIIGYTEMLQEEAGQERLLPELHVIWTSGQQLLRVVNELLDALQSDPDQARLPRLQKQMQELLEQVIGKTREIEESADSRGELDISSDVQKVRQAAISLLELLNHRNLDSALRLMDLTVTYGGQVNSPEGNPEPSPAAISEIRPSIEPSEGGRVNPGLAKVDPGFILVVEDNGTSRDLLCRRLERQGHRVAEAHNGRVALEMVDRNNFDLILLDVMMPEIDGYHALRTLKSGDFSRHIPVIMLSALGELASVVKCL